MSERFHIREGIYYNIWSANSSPEKILQWRNSSMEKFSSGEILEKFFSGEILEKFFSGEILGKFFSGEDYLVKDNYKGKTFNGNYLTETDGQIDKREYCYL